MSWHSSLWVHAVWDSQGFLDWVAISFLMLGKFSTYSFLKYFPYPFFFFFLFWDLYNSNVGVLNIFWEVSEAVLISFHSFLFILLCFSYFQCPYLPACLSILLPKLFCSLFPLVCFFNLSYYVIHHWQSILYFSRSLLNISCIFSVSASILRFWIIFTIITLNSFLGMLPISSSFTWSYRFLPCSFVCNIDFCHFIFLMGGTGCSCRIGCLVWGIQHWSLHSVGLNQVLVPRWILLG